VILTAILSAANSGLYASGRMLWSLSNEKRCRPVLPN
jgi:S-methylmethionine transporter